MPKELKICESFLGFIAVSDCSAEGLKTEILNTIKEYGIDLTTCRWQGYDGANIMSGVYWGLQTLIKEYGPNADYVREVSIFFDNLEKNIYFFWLNYTTLGNVVMIHRENI